MQVSPKSSRSEQPEQSAECSSRCDPVPAAILQVRSEKVDQRAGKYRKGDRRRPLKLFPENHRERAQPESRPEPFDNVAAREHQEQRRKHQYGDGEGQPERDRAHREPGARFAHAIRQIERGNHRAHAAGSEPQGHNDPKCKFPACRVRSKLADGQAQQLERRQRNKIGKIIQQVSLKLEAARSKEPHKRQEEQQQREQRKQKIECEFGRFSQRIVGAELTSHASDKLPGSQSTQFPERFNFALRRGS